MRGIGKGKWARQGAMLGIVLLIGFFALAGCAGTETQVDNTRGAMVKLAKNPCAAKNPCNPCAEKNPCAAKNPCNPCAAKNPCNPCVAKNPCNPCAAKNPCNPCAAKNPCNPCAAKNPCNPCNPCGGGKLDPKMISRPAGVKPYSGDRATLVAEGKKLWNDPSIGTSGLACGVCHLNYGNLQKTFLDAYPHRVAMAEQRAGLKQVNSDEMVQLCMVVPMAGKPLGWESRELAALAAYTEEFQKGFKGAVAANPCLLKASANPCNPCGARNPCNPCAAKNPCNPCAAKNPCNPCAAKNPCNPCGKK